MPSTRLLLVDGTGIIFRGFFAIRNLSTRDGVPTNAVFGFIRMLRQLKELWKPTHVVVVLDGGKPVRRVELLPDYKGNRAPTPDDLRAQVPLVEQYLTRSRTAWVREDGQEADDVLAVLSREAADSAEVLVATSDKDMLQLVDDSVRVVAVSGKSESLDAEGVKEKTGVLPSQIVEWLALTGDSADNIPGVPGVGPKTAAQLLGRFGSLKALWEHLGDVKREKLREALRAARADVERNVELVRLDSDIPCGIRWIDGALTAPDTPSLLAFYEQLEFDVFAKELREPGLFDL